MKFLYVKKLVELKKEVVHVGDIWICKHCGGGTGIAEIQTRRRAEGA